MTRPRHLAPMVVGGRFYIAGDEPPYRPPLDPGAVQLYAHGNGIREQHLGMAGIVMACGHAAGHAAAAFV